MTRRITPLLLLLVTITGCSKSAPKISGLTPVSRAGEQYFQQAEEDYIDARQRDLDGAPLEDAMSRTMLRLRSATDTDPGCALFHSKLGDVCVDNGQLAQAESHYLEAQRVHEDWPHAWIGLSVVARHQGEYAAARQHLQSARHAWETLKLAPEEEEEVTFLDIIGLNIEPSDPGPDPHDPRYDSDATRRMLINWMRASEEWTAEGTPLTQRTPDGKRRVRMSDVFRRVHARIEYEEARIMGAEVTDGVMDDDGTRSVAVMTQLQHARQFDPDFFPATIDLAMIYRERGDYQTAQSLLHYWANSEDPRFAENARLMLAMAELYASWFDVAPDAEKADTADGYFNRLHTINPDHVKGYIARARFYIAAGRHFHRVSTLEAAITCLDQVRRVRGGEDDTETRDLRLRAQASMRELETERGAAS